MLSKATELYNKASATRRTASWQAAVTATALKQAERRGEKGGATPPAVKRPPRMPSAAAPAAATASAIERASSAAAAAAAAAIEGMCSTDGVPSAAGGAAADGAEGAPSAASEGGVESVRVAPSSAGIQQGGCATCATCVIGASSCASACASGGGGGGAGLCLGRASPALRDSPQGRRPSGGAPLVDGLDEFGCHGTSMVSVGDRRWASEALGGMDGAAPRHMGAVGEGDGCPEDSNGARTSRCCMAQPPRHAETADFERSLHAVTQYAHACPLTSLPHAHPHHPPTHPPSHAALCTLSSPQGPRLRHP